MLVIYYNDLIFKGILIANILILLYNIDRMIKTKIIQHNDKYGKQYKMELNHLNRLKQRYRISVDYQDINKKYGIKQYNIKQ
jgi:hypothetical protein